MHTAVAANQPPLNNQSASVRGTAPCSVSCNRAFAGSSAGWSSGAALGTGTGSGTATNAAEAKLTSPRLRPNWLSQSQGGIGIRQLVGKNRPKRLELDEPDAATKLDEPDEEPGWPQLPW
jgi:hypothetical protein